MYNKYRGPTLCPNFFYNYNLMRQSLWNGWTCIFFSSLPLSASIGFLLIHMNNFEFAYWKNTTLCVQFITCPKLIFSILGIDLFWAVFKIASAHNCVGYSFTFVQNKMQNIDSLHSQFVELKLNLNYSWVALLTSIYVCCFRSAGQPRADQLLIKSASQVF